MKKRILSLLLGAALLLGTAGCGQDTETTDTTGAAAGEETTVPQEITEEQDAAVMHLLNDIASLLGVYEQRIVQENYAYQRMMDIGTESSWDNYVHARSACAFTVKLVGQFSQTPIPRAMTESDMTILTDMGIDAESLWAEVDIYNEITLNDLATVDLVRWNEYYMHHMMETSYDPDFLDVIVESAQCDYTENLLNLQFYYLLANYVLLDLPAAYANKLTAHLAENTPMIMAAYDKPFSTKNDIENEVTRVLNGIEEELVRAQEILTLWNSLQPQQSFDRVEISGCPIAVPFPAFAADHSYRVHYLWNSDEGYELAGYAGEREELPDTMEMVVEGVTKEEWLAYSEELREIGLEPLVNDTSLLFGFTDGTEVFVVWEEASTTLLVNGQICFAPMWFLVQ